MKILDKYLLKTFLITFTTVFVILFFIFILQTVWLFIAELAGRDLGFFMIIRFLLYSMPRIIPLVLPLSVLLASIMTFGSLAENYEFAAIKSAGISLGRAMKYLTYFILILTGITFFFANNVIPYAEYKFINFRRNIAQQSPAMSIVEGQFSEVGNYTIKVREKSGEKGNFLKDVTIHIKANDGTGLKTVIKAKTGELVSSESSNILKLVLKNGYYYEDIVPKKYEERNKIPFAKSSFEKDVINIDLSKLNTNMDTGEIANTNTMLNISQLKYTIDSLNTNYKKDVKSYALNISQRNQLASNNILDSIKKNKTNLKKVNLNDITGSFPIYQKEAIYKNAKNNIESTLLSIEGSRFEFNEKLKNINNHWIAFYDKFVIAFSCILMFFIGAPLGAIIRKGGLGLPIVFAVGIFIIFHFVNTFGKKLAQQNGITPFIGTWMSTIILLPLAILLTYRATNDIGLVSFDNLLSSVNDFFQKVKPKKKTNIKKIIENSNKHTNPVKVKSEINNSQEIEKIIKTYNTISLISIILYVLIILLIVVFSNNYNSINIIQIVLIVVLLSLIFLSQKKINQLEVLTKQKLHPGLVISILLGFPFYILIYLYNRFTLSKLK